MLSALLDGRPLLLHEPQWDETEAALRTASREGRLLAPCCQKPLVLRWGIRVSRHFAHYPRARCPFQRWSEPESPEHVAGKVRLYEWCRHHFGREALVALEHPLREIAQRPDIYVQTADGRRFALEYQRSAISLKEWTERHAGYQSLSVTDIWILGENRLAEAQPEPLKAARWVAQEPGMHFLNLRAFENACGPQTSYEIPWWRGEGQEELWSEQELAARTGRPVSPWFHRAALRRLHSITFLDAGTGLLHIYRGMLERRGHVDTRMASVCLSTDLEAGGLALTADGFVTAADQQRYERYHPRAERLAAAAAQNRSAEFVDRVAESAPRYQAEPAMIEALLLPEEAKRRERLLESVPFDAVPFRLEAQEAEQRRWLGDRAEVPYWRRLVDRVGLTPTRLFFLVGIPIPDDTVIRVHRTVWQAFIFYGLLRGQREGSFLVRWVRQHLERRFGFDPEMVRVATYLMPGRLNGPDQVIGTYLNLLVDAGYLRNEQRSEHFRYHRRLGRVPLVFADRTQRFAAWAGLLEGRLRLEGDLLVGGEEPIALLPFSGRDRAGSIG